MNKKKLIIITGLLLVILGASSIYISSLGKVNSGYVGEGQVIDMLGRSVDVPTTINKVAGLSHSATVIVYMLGPDTLVGWDSTRVYTQNKYMDSNYSTLPYLGGGKKDANYENYIKVAPDIVFIGHGGEPSDIDTFQQKLGSIALVDVENDNNLSTITDSIEFIGKVLKKEEKSNKLIEFYNNYSNLVDERVKDIPEAEKKRVYYTTDATGLKSFSEGSQHTELIEKCGGKNVVEVPITKGTSGISIEQVLEWNPDVIIASDP
ncbi:MAG: ABC transporter substrate-binding protein, partial [Methanobacteriaceae archaeon]